jgi:cytochrome c-type biogenesis protein CcmH/NrfG
MSAVELGDNRRAIGLTGRLISRKDEAAAEYVLGRALFREKMVSEAKDALAKSEKMDPPSAYRCWSALQIALILADKPMVLRECNHLTNSPQYGPQVKKILDEVNKRG